MVREELRDNPLDEANRTFSDKFLLSTIKLCLYSLSHTQQTAFVELVDEEDSRVPTSTLTEQAYEAIDALSLDNMQAKVPLQSGFMLELLKLSLQWTSLALSPEARLGLFDQGPINVPSKAHDTIEQQRRL